MEWGRHCLELGRRTCIMGIVNVTPDSFSDGGRFLDPGHAVAQGLRLAAEGADIIDIGGESTRPFSESVSADEEIRRVVPVVAELAEKIRIPISIDANDPDVAAAAVEAGASILNDITAFADERMARLAVAHVVIVGLGGNDFLRQVPRERAVRVQVVATLLGLVGEARHEGLGVGVVAHGRGHSPRSAERRSTS